MTSQIPPHVASRAAGVIGRSRAAAFPPVPSRGPVTFAVVLAHLGWFAAAMAYLLLVPAGASRWDRVWAEDGRVWMGDALTLGFPASILEPLDGYFHTVPRLISQVAITLPIETWPFAISVMTAAVRAALALVIYAASRPYVPSRIGRWAIAGAIIWLPSANAETIGNAANLHWFLFYGAFWLLLWRLNTWWGTTLQAIALLAVATSLPMGLALLPIAAARIVFLSGRLRVAGIVWAAGAAVAVPSLLTSDRERAPLQFVEWLLSTAVRGPLETLIGPQLTFLLVGGTVDAVVVAVTLLAVGVIVALAIAAIAARRSSALLIGTLLFYGAFAVAFPLYANWKEELWIADPLKGERYSAASTLFFFAAIVVSIGVIGVRHHRFAQFCGAGVLTAVLAGVGAQIVYPPINEGSAILSGRTWSESIAEGRGTCDASESARLLVLPHDGWWVDVPCVLLTNVDE